MLWKHGRNRLRMPGSWWACVGLIAGVVGELYQALCMADCESVRNRAWVAENLGLNFREKVYVCVCMCMSRSEVLVRSLPQSFVIPLF